MTCEGFHKEDEEIEYCRTRMDGSMKRKLPNGSLICGCSSRISSKLSRLETTSSACELCKVSSDLRVSSGSWVESNARMSRLVAGIAGSIGRRPGSAGKEPELVRNSPMPVARNGRLAYSSMQHSTIKLDAVFFSETLGASDTSSWLRFPRFCDDNR